ncbi:MAG: cobalt-precorrin-5B (C(1))-methyltransferase [Pseudomonadota bacterium]
MTEASKLRTGFTTGACATAAAAAAAGALMGCGWRDPVAILLPRGQRAEFALAERGQGPGWAHAAIVKDAGDDPDVTHGALIRVTLRPGPAGSGVRFCAGEGVGMVTRPGLPIPPGEPAINPVPRRMIADALTEIAGAVGQPADLEVEIAVPGGAALALRTWNPRLGIEGGISILGTTGIVRPFSCAAWIASIHRGIDVARAAGLGHVAGSTGATSEATAQNRFGLPDHAMLDMGDFAGGMLKYLRTHPVARVTVAGGFAKLTKLAQGALDLHSARSQVDFAALAELAEEPQISEANTAAQALDMAGPRLAVAVAGLAQRQVANVLGAAPVAADVLVVGRDGRPLAEADNQGARAL